MADFKRDLEQCESLEQMFNVIRLHYQTEKKLGPIARPMAVKKLLEFTPKISIALSIPKR